MEQLTKRGDEICFSSLTRGKPAMQWPLSCRSALALQPRSKRGKVAGYHGKDDGPSRVFRRRRARSIGELFCRWCAADDADRCRRTGRARRDPEAWSGCGCQVSPMPNALAAGNSSLRARIAGNRRRLARGSVRFSPPHFGRFVRVSRQNRRRRGSGHISSSDRLCP